MLNKSSQHIFALLLISCGSMHDSDVKPVLTDLKKNDDSKTSDCSDDEKKANNGQCPDKKDDENTEVSYDEIKLEDCNTKVWNEIKEEEPNDYFHSTAESNHDFLLCLAEKVNFTTPSNKLEEVKAILNPEAEQDEEQTEEDRRELIEQQINDLFKINKINASQPENYKSESYNNFEKQLEKLRVNHFDLSGTNINIINEINETLKTSNFIKNKLILKIAKNLKEKCVDNDCTEEELKNTLSLNKTYKEVKNKEPNLESQFNRVKAKSLLTLLEIRKQHALVEKELSEVGDDKERKEKLDEEKKSLSKIHSTLLQLSKNHPFNQPLLKESNLVLLKKLDINISQTSTKKILENNNVELCKDFIDVKTLENNTLARVDISYNLQTKSLLTHKFLDKDKKVININSKALDALKAISEGKPDYLQFSLDNNNGNKPCYKAPAAN